MLLPKVAMVQSMSAKRANKESILDVRRLGLADIYALNEQSHLCRSNVIVPGFSLFIKPLKSNTLSSSRPSMKSPAIWTIPRPGTC